jgi:fructose-1,6-bisphosphatase/sedoheptulose 1,7-bisphosphatase-like protein
MKTFKLMQGIAYLIFAAGALLIFIGMSDGAGNTQTGAVSALLIGLLGSLILGSLFLFFAKVIEQNEDRKDQQEELQKLLTEMGDKLNKIYLTTRN